MRAGKPGSRRLKVYFDGGCRPNPGPIEAAVVIRGRTYYFDDLGTGGSSDAEWLALIEALRLAQSLGEDRFDLIGDSAHVIERANGVGTCHGGAAQAHFERFASLASSTPAIRVKWVPRSQNLAGIALERRRAGLAN